MSAKVHVRRLNENGIARYASLDWGATDSAGDPPKEIRFDDDYSEVVTFSNGKTRSIDADTHFETYSELVDVIDECLGSGMDIQEVEGDKGLWAWFSLLFYEMLRNGAPGSWKKAARPRFIPSGKSNSYYRHQVYSPYALAKMHGKESAAIFLCAKTDGWPEINEQILSVAPLISHQPLISTATALYYDSEKGKAMPGAASKDGEGPYKGSGSARRFRTVFWQLYETYDLRSMNESQIISILPPEFDAFKTSEVTS